MSGIVGIFDVCGRSVPASSIETMIHRMAHRGPDGLASRVVDNIGFGYCRTASTVPRHIDRQPLVSPDGRVVTVFDGWLSDPVSVLGRLGKQDTHTLVSDAQIVLWAYQAWGDDFLLQIDGDFAFAVFDYSRNSLFCGRDRMGHRPFNYCWDGERLTFASEVSAILAVSTTPKELNSGTIAEFLAVEWHSLDQTFWCGIMRLPPAHVLLLESGKLTLRQYWFPIQGQRLKLRSEGECSKLHLEKLSAAVREASRSTNVVAAEVSGGLDSSSVFATAIALHRSGGLPAQDVIGLTMAFPNDPKADESELVAEIARFLGVPITAVEPSVLPLVWFAERARREMDFPGYPNGVMHLGLAQEARARGARVLLTGMGGDEWFGDFFRSRAYYREELLSGNFKVWGDWFRADVGTVGLGHTAKWIAKALLPFSLLVGIRRLRTWLQPDDTRFVPSLALSDELNDAMEKRRSKAERRAEDRAGIVHDPFTIWTLEVQERMAASVGLDLRHPLRSAQLVEYALQLPARLLRKGPRNKYLHVYAMKGVLPDKVLELGNKASFTNTFVAQLAVFTSKELSPRWSNPVASYKLNEVLKGDLGRVRSLTLWRLSSYVGCVLIEEASLESKDGGRTSEPILEEHSVPDRREQSRRIYVRPTLSTLGTVAELTGPDVGSGFEGGSGMVFRPV
jgi:asparagine synthase (glutamine-hydrolysing)